MSSLRLGTFPTLVAGGLPRSWLGQRTRLAWSFLTRQKLDVRLGERLEDPFEMPGGRSAAEQYVDQQVNESWGGLTLAYELSETLGIGATLYGVYRGQFSRTELNFQALSAEEAALTGLSITDYSYYHFRTLAKLGVAWQRGDVHLGLNVTTPSVALFGSGDAGFTASLVGMDTDGNGTPDPPLLVSNTAEGVDAHYKSSWAIGGGLAWNGGPHGGRRAPSGSLPSTASPSSTCRSTKAACRPTSRSSSGASSTSVWGWSTTSETSSSSTERP